MAQSNIKVRDIQGREYATESSQMAFGRDTQCKVCFHDGEKSVSTHHCVLYKENGKLYLMDQGSTNGTFFSEEERLKSNVPYRVNKGTAFFLCSRRYTFVIAE